MQPHAFGAVDELMTLKVNFAIALWQNDRRSLRVALGLVVVALAVNEWWARSGKARHVVTTT